MVSGGEQGRRDDRVRGQVALGGSIRFVIFGTGGVGGYFGALLARAGEDVVFIARGAHLQAMRERGLRVEAPDESIVVHPVRATDNPAEAGVADVIILAVKTPQVPEAVQAMRPVVGPHTTILPLLNGVEAVGQLAAAFGAERVLGGLCGTISWLEAPGVVRSIGSINFIRFGEMDDRLSERTAALRQAFERAGIRGEIPPSIQVAIWDKFLFVVPFGSVGAVARAPAGITRRVPETRRIVEACMHEIVALGRARGVAFTDGSVAKAMGVFDSIDPGATSSLQRDLADGRPSELEAWIGAVVRLGRDAKVPTPVSDVIYGALLPSEMRARALI